MKKLVILFFSIVMAGEMTVDGDLKVNGKIVFSDSTTIQTAPIQFPIFNGIKSFNSNTNWTVPPNISSVFVKCIGGGGGGTGTGTGCWWGGAGGGSGGYVMGVINVIPNEILTLTIGGGGSGVGSCSSAENGGDTFIKRGDEILAIANGGGGGVGIPLGSNGGGGGGYSIENGIGKTGNNGGSGTYQGSAGGAGVAISDGFFTAGSGGSGASPSGGGSGSSGQSGLIVLQW